MKSIYTLLYLSIFTCLSAVSQNPVTIGTPENDTIYVLSGQNFLLIPDIDDNDAGIDQSISFTVSSSDPDILRIDNVEFTPGNRLAVINVTEQGQLGSVTIQVEAKDPDGTANASCDVIVGNYNNPGIFFEIHDVVFWQQMVPLNANPAFRMIATSGLAPYNEIDLPSLELSVYSDCRTSPPCTGTDFFTGFFKGYVIPPVTGSYTFYMISGDQCCVGLSTDEDFSNASLIIHSSQGIGTNSGDKEWKSSAQNLEAGKVYAIYGTQWNIHTLTGGLLWEGPGISKGYIEGQYLSYVYDTSKPTIPGNLNIINTGINDITLMWTESSDNKFLEGYNIYLNGILNNPAPVTGCFYKISSLLPESHYSVCITALDKAGNESLISNILSTTTYLSDINSPTPPDVISAPIVSDLAIILEWSGATDSETEIRGYNVYVNGILYNPDDYIYTEYLTISNLNPGTSYQVQIESVDAGYNVSPKSEAFNIETKNFDPNDTQLTDKKARLTVQMENIGYNAGLGINVDYSSGQFLKDAELVKIIKDLEPAGIRWGALTANPLNFNDFIGTGKQITFAKFMTFCNEIDAYSIITCGVESSTDWMTDTTTFLHFLEYIAGPSNSEYGIIRASEGYNESLLASSKGLIFEFGNEVWGADAHNAQIGSDYAKYGEWCRKMAVIMRSSDYYNPEKIFLVYSGREPHPSNSYGLHDNLMKGDTGEVDWLAVGGYLGGNLNYAPEIDPGDSELDYYKNGIATVEYNLKGMVLTMKDMIELTGEIKPTFMYEANMTKNTYFGRLGQAIVQMDYYSSAIETGGAIPTIFHLSGGQWKMVVPAQDYKKTPLYHTAAFFNKYCKGSILKTELTTMARIQDSDEDTLDFESIGCYAYVENGRYSLLFLSRDFENDYTVQIDLPEEIQLIAPETARRFTITGNNYSDNDAVIDSSIITISDNLLIQVPKYSMVIITFQCTDPQFEPLPLGHYEYVSATDLTIIAYKSDIMDITTNKQKKIYTVTVVPENAFSDEVTWEVITNNVNLKSLVNIIGLNIYGSGTCEGNGSIILKAYAWDNRNVYDEVAVNISNQGTECGTGLYETGSNVFKIYPNPVNDRLFIENMEPDDINQIEIYDVLGIKYLSLEIHEEKYTINIEDLKPGIYILTVSNSTSQIKSLFIK